MGPPNRNQRVVSGNVTKIFGERNEFGFIDDEIFFQQAHVTDGPAIVGNRVYAECQYTEGLPVKWNAIKLKIIQPSLGQAQSSQLNVPNKSLSSELPMPIDMNLPPPPLPGNSANIIHHCSTYKSDHIQEFYTHARPPYPGVAVASMQDHQGSWAQHPFNFMNNPDLINRPFLPPAFRSPFPDSTYPIAIPPPTNIGINQQHEQQVRRSRWGGSHPNAPLQQEFPVARNNLQSDERGIIPSALYYELPAGLMVPLIKLADNDYKSLDPNELRLPHPSMPSERLLNAIDAFYAATTRDRPRDADGWDRHILDEFLRRKAEAASSNP